MSICESSVITRSWMARARAVTSRSPCGAPGPARAAAPIGPISRPVTAIRARQPIVTYRSLLGSDLKDITLDPAGLVQLPVKAQVLAPDKLRNVQNLPVVHAKVLDDLIDGMKAGDCVALNVEGAEEVGFGQPREDR